MRLLLALLLAGCTSMPPSADYLRSHAASVPKLLKAGGGGGTAFFMEYKGVQWLVSNRHVCDYVAENGSVVVEWDTGVQIKATVVEAHTTSDLCLLTTPYKAEHPFKLASGYELHEEVWSIGHPALYNNVVSEGRIFDKKPITLIASVGQECLPNQKAEKLNLFFFSVDVCMQDYMALHLSNVIHGGNSGSPLLNKWGNVVGVVFAGDSRTHYGMAVPLEELRAFLDKYNK